MPSWSMSTGRAPTSTRKLVDAPRFVVMTWVNASQLVRSSSPVPRDSR
jgi:hypothetical protein